MPKKIFIGSLSAQTKEPDLESLCRNLDGLSSVHIEREEDGSIRGIAEFTSDESAAAALRRLQGQNLNGQRLRVSEVR